jgi:hypothetical protein
MTLVREGQVALYSHRDYCSLPLRLFLQQRIQKAIPVIELHRQVAKFSLSHLPWHEQDNELVIN